MGHGYGLPFLVVVFGLLEVGVGGGILVVGGGAPVFEEWDFAAGRLGVGGEGEENADK
jgi:hypothetical protein